MITKEDADFEYVIAGAGLSGLALATSIIRSPSQINRANKNFCLIEPRKRHAQDHIWSFWNNVQMPLVAPIAKQWNKWKVRFGKKTFTCVSQNYPYCSVFAEDYYANALLQIEQSSHSNILWGEQLDAVEYRKDKILLKTSNRTLTSQLLFDSRPPSFDPTDFKQEFLGLRVRASKRVFDTECLTLMDFSGILMKRGFHFFYVLPFSQTEALVESVYVGLESTTEDEHRKMLAGYLKSEYGLEAYEEVYVERGCLPMQPISNKEIDSRHYLLGARGGLLRPSTAYGFASIHVFSEQLAALLAKEERPKPPEIFSNKSKLLDTVLLSYLRGQPQDGPMLLSALFEKVNPDVLVRFLADRSSLVDDAAIFAAMPKKMELGAIMARTQIEEFR